jgi:hypothetical protein
MTEQQSPLSRLILAAMIPLAPTIITAVIYLSHLDAQVTNNTIRLNSIDSGGSRLLQLLDLRLKSVELDSARTISTVNMLGIHLAVLEERDRENNEQNNEKFRTHADALRRLEDATFGVFQNKITPQRTPPR